MTAKPRKPRKSKRTKNAAYPGFKATLKGLAAKSPDIRKALLDGSWVLDDLPERSQGPSKG